MPSRPEARLAATLAVALAAALAAQALRLPLPWLLGPLLVTAALGLAGLPVRASNRLRNAGQWAIGTALGLYFTPAVMAWIVRLAPALVAGVLWAFVLGYGFYRWLLPRAGGDRATAFFSAAIGGASEMAVQAERHGGRIDRVASAHSLRVLLVVTLVPLGLQLAGLHGVDALPPSLAELRPGGLAVLAAATFGGVALFAWLDTPTPWVLGALVVSMAVTACGFQLSGFPRPLSNAAQLVIGISLGTRFSPEFMRAAPAWLAAVAAGTLAMIAASLAFAAALAWVSGLHPATVTLATAPGGIAEMAITAKVLQLGVPAVTAFQAVRYVAVLTLTPVFFRWERGRGTVRAG